MSVTANIKITQFEAEDTEATIRESVFTALGTAVASETPLSLSSWSNQTHQPAVQQPAASSVPGGWQTRTPEDQYWSDSPIHQPLLLYKRRYAFGRDIKEIFVQPAVPGQAAQIAVNGSGDRWGNLDANSGVLQYDRLFSLDSYTSALEFQIHNLADIREKDFSVNSDSNVKELGPVTGETTIREVDFLLAALPVPNSVKNPVATDISIRLGNFTSVFDEDSFVLYIDGQLQTGLDVDEFFSGLGGFDVTWTNSVLFDYGSQVDVRWEFRDLAFPPNLFVIQYPFYTVPDSAGPRVTNLVPNDEAVNVPISGALQFDLEDFESDVDIDSLLLYVNNIKVVGGETGTLQLTRFQNKKGYTVKYTHNEPFLYGDLIPVAFFVKDTSERGNVTFYTYSFTTLESTPPRLLNLRPLSCTVAVPVGTHVSVDVIDGGHGLNKDSIVFTVEEIERGGQIALIPIVHRDE